MAKRQRRKKLAEINVVPYIDVMLVLLIIFMATTPLMTEGVDVDLPQADARPIDVEEVETTEPFIVTVDKAGQFFVNQASDPEAPQTAESVKRRARATLSFEPTTKVLVRGDADASHGSVVAAMVLLQQAGAASVGIVTQPPELAGGGSL